LAAADDVGREVTGMVVLVLLGVILVVTALLVPLMYARSVVLRRRDRPAVAAPAVAAPAPDRADEREESRLAAALVAGDIPMIWYQQRMAGLAARDDARDPLAVPPTTGESPDGPAPA
jgi:Na+-transporting methylmalonyl-CoA/oxaloacetate decarboxylase gamma subunit